MGEAIPGVEVRIADDGEVLARGPRRFAGYWENPEATAAAIDADGWYHTGDLGDFTTDGFLTLRGRKKDMLAMPDGKKVYPEDIEAVLRRRRRVSGTRPSSGWPPGADLHVHAVLLIDDPAAADAVVADANARLAPTSRSAGPRSGPIHDLPRTHTLKVKKPDVLARLGRALERPGAAPHRRGRVELAGDDVDADADPVTAIVAVVAGARPARSARATASRATSTSTRSGGSSCWA